MLKKLLFLFFLPSLIFAQKEVLTSIKPFYLLTKEIAGDKIHVELLVNGQASHHGYLLKPSDVKKLEKAELMIWGGKDVEPFLSKLAKDKKNLNLAEIPNLHLITPGEHRCCDHNHHHDHHHHEEDLSIDPHFWLNSTNGIIIAKAITKELIQISPENEEYFTKNSKKLIENIKTTKKNIEKELKMLSHKPFVVFHDAYRYFEEEFKLNKIDTLLINPEVPPSIKKMTKIQSLLENHLAFCIFIEPQFNPKIVSNLKEKIPEIKVGTLDPLGSTIDLNSSYTEILTQISKEIHKCLS